MTNININIVKKMLTEIAKNSNGQAYENEKSVWKCKDGKEFHISLSHYTRNDDILSGEEIKLHDDFLLIISPGCNCPCEAVFYKNISTIYICSGYK